MALCVLSIHSYSFCLTIEELSVSYGCRMWCGNEFMNKKKIKIERRKFGNKSCDGFVFLCYVRLFFGLGCSLRRFGGTTYWEFIIS